jgi:hypothetical protein
MFYLGNNAYNPSYSIIVANTDCNHHSSSSLWAGVLLAALDTSIVAVVMSQIGSEFQRSNQIVLIATAYLLSYTALQPLCKLKWTAIRMEGVADEFFHCIRC